MRFRVEEKLSELGLSRVARDPVLSRSHAAGSALTCRPDGVCPLRSHQGHRGRWHPPLAPASPGFAPDGSPILYVIVTATHHISTPPPTRLHRQGCTGHGAPTPAGDQRGPWSFTNADGRSHPELCFNGRAAGFGGAHTHVPGRTGMQSVLRAYSTLLKDKMEIRLNLTTKPIVQRVIPWASEGCRHRDCREGGRGPDAGQLASPVLPLGGDPPSQVCGAAASCPLLGSPVPTA